MKWHIIESGCLPPADIMAKDAALLANLDSHPILHFYEWQGSCLTYGYFTDPSRYLHLDQLSRYQLHKARRPTGGGIIFHLTDWAFSLLIPAHHPCVSVNTLENYAFINRQVAEVVAVFMARQVFPQLLAQEPVCVQKECHAFCMAKPTQYDLIVEGKKVGGAAQRRTRQGLLHQASLSLLFPPLDLLQAVLKNAEEVLPAMQANTCCLLSEDVNLQELQTARQTLQHLLAKRMPKL